IQGSSFLWWLLLQQNKINLPLAICTFGHHGGLDSQHKIITQNRKLYEWWKNEENNSLKKLMQNFLINFSLVTPEKLPDNKLKQELLLRMLFSALVDADFLDTEKHFNVSQSVLRTNSVQPSDL